VPHPLSLLAFRFLPSALCSSKPPWIHLVATFEVHDARNPSRVEPASLDVSIGPELRLSLPLFYDRRATSIGFSVRMIRRRRVILVAEVVVSTEDVWDKATTIGSMISGPSARDS